MAESRVLEIPVSVQPVDAIRALRLIAESRDWQTERIEESRMVHRWAIIMPLSRQARVIGFGVKSGEANGFSIRAWSETPGSAGAVSHIAFEIPYFFEESFKELLKEWVETLERCPWKWSFTERSQIGYLLPEFRRSRVQFSREGIDISEWSAKESEDNALNDE